MAEVRANGLPWRAVLLSRRTFVGGVAGALTLAATRRANAEGPGGEDLEVRDLQLPGERALGRRMTLSVPRYLKPGERAPLLVLLHGLGETGDERAGVYAWLERYGLGSAYARLRRPPVVRTAKRRDFTDEHLAAVNADLAKQAFRGFVIACPYTPNINKVGAAALDGYAKWIAEEVVPRARKEAPVVEDAARTAIDGCSLGGYVAIEVFLRRPELFGALGGVQAAIGAYRAEGYAERLGKIFAATKVRPLHLETSTADPFLEANQIFAAALKKKGITHELVVLPGPHDQPWLREVGTLEMLRWHDRRFAEAGAKGP
jgi:predicted esterase